MKQPVQIIPVSDLFLVVLCLLIRHGVLCLESFSQCGRRLVGRVKVLYILTRVLIQLSVARPETIVDQGHAYSALPAPTAHRGHSKDSYKKRKILAANKMSSFLMRLHKYVLCANQSLSLCYPYSILQHARRAFGGDWVLYASPYFDDLWKDSEALWVPKNSSWRPDHVVRSSDLVFRGIFYV